MHSLTKLPNSWLLGHFSQDEIFTFFRCIVLFNTSEKLCEGPTNPESQTPPKKKDGQWQREDSMYCWWFRNRGDLVGIYMDKSPCW